MKNISEKDIVIYEFIKELKEAAKNREKYERIKLCLLSAGNDEPKILDFLLKSFELVEKGMPFLIEMKEGTGVA